MMGKIIRSIVYITVIVNASSCLYRTGNDNESDIDKKNRLGKFILHDDYTNLFLTSSSDTFLLSDLKSAARKAAMSGSDIISVSASLGELVNYYPGTDGETIGLQDDLADKIFINRQGQLIRAGIDPYKAVLSEIRSHGIPVLAKFRVNDRHHVAGHSYLASTFWKEHPEWYIGYSERDTSLLESFRDNPSVSANAIEIIKEDRPMLFDYSVPEVRQKRLAIFREVIERYDVAGATLNFLREPYCVSFPRKNAVYLTEFVRQCRQVLDEILIPRGIEKPILGVLIPWDIDFCRAMGMEVDVWIKEGLLDYVSPSEGWVTDFNMDIKPWIRLTRGTSTGVYPGINGLIAFKADLCLPEEYKTEGKRVRSAKIMPEHVRALAHRFNAEGAQGLSSFNLYSAYYSYLFPLPDLVSSDNFEGSKRVYTYMKGSRYIEWDFLKLHLTAADEWSKSLQCHIHEKLNSAKAYLSFKALGIEDVSDLVVLINGKEISLQRFENYANNDRSFIYPHYIIESGDIRDGSNEIAFSLKDKAKNEVVVQEIEIRVNC